MSHKTETKWGIDKIRFSISNAFLGQLNSYNAKSSSRASGLKLFLDLHCAANFPTLQTKQVLLELVSFRSAICSLSFSFCVG